MSFLKNIVAFCLFLFSVDAFSSTIPPDFVYLQNYAPSILQDIRYAGHHNFIGRPIAGYETNACILTKAAAKQLKHVQQQLLQSGYSLKVYDCYRPTQAVDDFVQWSHNYDRKMAGEFYPNLKKEDLFSLKYVATKSSHSRGSTVDLTIVPVPTMQQEVYHQNQPLVACFAPFSKRFHDNSLDMGTGYDCMDEKSHPLNKSISLVAHQNRMLLRNLMIQDGFVPYPEEWWHFTLKDEPYKDTYFNFKVVAAQAEKTTG